MITWEVWSRVVAFSGERSELGTAFLIGSGADQLLLTARHLCTDAPDEIVTVVHPWTDDGRPIHDNGSRVRADISPTADFAIFRLSEPITNLGSDPRLSSDGLQFSQQAFILGFPYLLGPQHKSGPQKLPIVKHCIIGGMSTGGDGVPIFHIDALVNPGFSGGPLVYVHAATGRLSVAGVISGALSGPLDKPTEERPNPQIGPAGIGLVVSEVAFRDAVTLPRSNA